MPKLLESQPDGQETMFDAIKGKNLADKLKTVLTVFSKGLAPKPDGTTPSQPEKPKE